MFKRVTVKKTNAPWPLRGGDFERVLPPGRHWLFAGMDALRVETFALESPPQPPAGRLPVSQGTRGGGARLRARAAGRSRSGPAL